MKSAVLPAATVITKPEFPNKIGFEFNPMHGDQVQYILKEMHRLGAQQLRVEISLVQRPRSTGPNSQNNHIWGHCSDIADQLRTSTGERMYNREEIEAAMKRMAVDEGYPTKMSVDGTETPRPLREASVHEAKLIIDVIHRFTDQHELYLTEVDDAGPYVSIGGRNREEMKKYVRS